MRRIIKKIKLIFGLIEISFESFYSKLINYRHLYIVRMNNPKATIKSNVIFLGNNINDILIGEKTIIENGVIIDTSYGGNIIIGNNCKIRSGVVLSPYGGQISIGNFTGINHNTILLGNSNIKIGNYVRIAPNCMIVASNHNFQDKNTPIYLQSSNGQGIEIKDDVWVGGNSSILDGVVINKGVVIAAGAVVNCNINEYLIVGGVPAKTIKNR